MSIDHTPYQRDRELGLVLTQLFHHLSPILGEEPMMQAFQVEERNPEFRDCYAPEDLTLEHFPVSDMVQRLELYVTAMEPMDRGNLQLVEASVDAVSGLVNLVCTPEQERIWADEAAKHPEVDEDNSEPDAPRFIAHGNYYRGLLRAMCNLSAARLKVDLGKPLTLGDIALLTGSKEATVMTAAHRELIPTYESGNRRLAEPREALAWMQERGYRPTRFTSDNSEPATKSDVDLDDAVFVPVAADGTYFGPHCKSGNGYTIGAKGAERKVNDYFEALALLQKMNTPYWRRENAAGNRGIVRGLRWDRMSRARLRSAAGDAA